MMSHVDASRSTNNKNKSNNWIHVRMEQQLESRRIRGTLRRLPAAPVKSAKEDTAMRAEVVVTTIDFSSNDYLGLAHDWEQQQLVEQEMKKRCCCTVTNDNSNSNNNGDQTTITSITATNSSQTSNRPLLLGATGSRLLSGDAEYWHMLEAQLALVHNMTTTLVCNSGYDANLAVVSCLPCDCILYDEAVHNSLHMGVRLWLSMSNHQPQQHPLRKDCTASSTRSSNTATTTTTALPVGNASISASFRHNNVEDLRRVLAHYSNSAGGGSSCTANPRRIAVLIESVYSMDGDVAPVQAILDTAASFGAVVVVDEAHGLGVFGRCTSGVDNSEGCDGTGILASVGCERHPALAFAVYTYGKAAGCHGALVACPHSAVAKEYLVNYAYPFIYSTALPLHSAIAIQCAYATITGTKGRRLRMHLWQLIQQFRTEMTSVLGTLSHNPNNVRLLSSTCPIQALIVPGNFQCTDFCERMYRRSAGAVRLYPIRSPTVATGSERVRVVLHAHNTAKQVSQLVEWIGKTVRDMAYATSTKPLRPNQQNPPMLQSKL